MSHVNYHSVFYPYKRRLPLVSSKHLQINLLYSISFLRRGPTRGNQLYECKTAESPQGPSSEGFMFRLVSRQATHRLLFAGSVLRSLCTQIMNRRKTFLFDLRISLSCFSTAGWKNDNMGRFHYQQRTCGYYAHHMGNGLRLRT